ncbi:MAG: DUF805 domain-containing protein [Flavobacterium sp.]|uniref:DUF805 domain-containing protein n=1 Tax=Flavobacterium sp. TaxID=239 RepID=UPI001B193884|nr:DUF805 domain-containing protein [Flavobacterium sp.]MBO9582814.1 DUF805 domain-containing protein [Flavobacterium sp.]
MIEMFKKVVFENYANFEGRARRKEYWMFILAYYIAIFALIFIASVLPEMIGGLLFAVFVLAIIIPTIAVTIRRMHDVGKSGWYSLIPYYNLYLCCIEGEKGPNQYGPDPKNQLEEINEIGKE